MVNFMQVTVQSRKEGYCRGKENENIEEGAVPLLPKGPRNKKTLFLGNFPDLLPPSHFLPNHFCFSLHQPCPSCHTFGFVAFVWKTPRIFLTDLSISFDHMYFLTCQLILTD